MKNFKRSAAFGTLVHAALFLFTLLGGWLSSALLERAMEGAGGLLPAALALAALLLAGLPLIYFLQRALGRLLREERQRWREKVYGGILAGRIQVDSAGELDVRLSNDADAVADYYQQALPSAAEGVGVLLGAAALICRVQPLLGLLLLALSLLQLLPTLVYEKWAREIYEQTHSAEERYDGWLIQGAEGLTALRACRREAWFLRKLAEISDGMVRAGCRAERTGAVENAVFQFTDGLLRYGSYLLAGLFVLYGGLAVSDTPVIFVLSASLFRSVDSLLDWRRKRAACRAALGHLTERALPEALPPRGAPLEAEALCKRFGEKQALSQVSLTVRAREKVLLSGPNGSGKSTLLRILLGLLPADSGTVRASRKSLSFALQEEAALPLTGAELSEALTREAAVDGGRMRALLAAFAVPETLLAKPLRQWSPGERKKFALAAAFARPAELLILDEPANHLDAGAVSVLCRLINEYDGAVLAADHHSALPVAWDRTVFLEGGGEP